MKLEFSQQIFGKHSYTKIHENPSVRAKLFHADGRTDMTKLITTFHNFVNVPKEWFTILVKYTNISKSANIEMLQQSFYMCSTDSATDDMNTKTVTNHELKLWSHTS